MIATARRSLPGLAQTRRLSVATGVLALLSLAFVPEGFAADRLALAALITLGFASVLGWSEMAVSGRPLRPVRDHKSGSNSRTWLLVVIGVALVAGLAVQTWFKPGTSIGGGDILPPDGTAWLGRFFEFWTWTGSNLGEPSQLPMELPWAVVLVAVHAVGGDPATAQRIFYTLLFIGAALGALSLLAALRMGPVAASVGSVVYVLNPYVVSEVNTYAVYLLAVGLLAAIPAVLVATGTGRVPILWGAALVAIASPLLGYVFFNPPLLGLILAATLATPLLVAWIDGRDAAFRSIQALLLATPLLLATSAYWVVPAILHLSGFAGTELVSLSTWTWTEGRATLRNAFWLNAMWGWNVPAFYPYAAAYDGLLLRIAEFALPAIAFGALALRHTVPNDDQRYGRERDLRLALAAGTVALIVIFISTGTNPPGNVVFNGLYGLPYGWLLREPGRFLILVALAYAVLSAVAVQALFSPESFVKFIKTRRLTPQNLQLAIVPGAVVSALLVGFPLYTGAVVPDTRPGLPPVHVQVPGYWGQMAQYVDGLPLKGALLVMPPDDYYQMPYSWGYYGSDGFIVEMFRRPVLVPNGQGYSPASSQVAGAVNLTAQSILDHDWPEAEALVRALNTPLILVRGDVDSTFPGRSILPPNDLAAALSASPDFVLVRRIGRLELFSLDSAATETAIGATFVTVNSLTPDLRLLSVLPPNAAIISGQSLSGVPFAVGAPPLELWQRDGNNLAWQSPAPSGWTYRIAELNSHAVAPIQDAGAISVDMSAHIAHAPDAASGNIITVSIPVRALISNGDFANGPWGLIDDCYTSVPAAPPYVAASVVASEAPNGLPASRLSASSAGACEGQSLAWRGGPVVLSFLVHHIEGAAPGVCLWEVGPNRCASIPLVPDQSGWSLYRTTVNPDSGTTAMSLILYSVPESGSRTTNDYANVSALGASGALALALLADPEASSDTLQLATDHTSFSTLWAGPIGSKHVLVDGMLNGWLTPSGPATFSATYGPATVVRAAQWASLITAVILLLVLSWSLARRLIGRLVAR